MYFKLITFVKVYTILSVFLLPLFGSAQANKLIRKGLKSTNPKEQIDLFTEAITLEPQNLDAYFYRGVAKDNMGDYYGAIIDYTKVVFSEPTADVYFNRGNSKYSLMDFDGARSDFEKALELAPEFLSARYSLAMAKYNLQDYNGAVSDLTSLPKTADVLVLLGQSYAGLDDFKNALLNYSLAIVYSKNSYTYYARGVFYLDINHYRKANEDFASATYYDNTNLSAYFFKGVSHYLLGEFDMAVKSFSMVSQNDPLDFDASLGLALGYVQLNDLSNAEINFKKAKSILKGNDPSKPDTIDLFVTTYWYIKQPDAFKRGFEALHKLQ